MTPIQPSGILCASCKEEIDLWDGPVRMVGHPMVFPFCWKCWQELYKELPQCDILAEEKDGKLFIRMEEGRGC